MPKNTDVPCPKGVPTQLTDTAVAAARVVGSQGFYLCATLTATPPTSYAGAVPMLPHSVLAEDMALGDLFPGVGDTVILWAWPTGAAISVSVSHS